MTLFWDNVKKKKCSLHFLFISLRFSAVFSLGLRTDSFTEIGPYQSPVQLHPPFINRSLTPPTSLSSPLQIDLWLRKVEVSKYTVLLVGKANFCPKSGFSSFFLALAQEETQPQGLMVGFPKPQHM